MIFSIDRKFFSDALNIVSRAISANSPVPAYSGIVMKLSAQNLVLTGTDSNVAIQVTIQPDELSMLKIEEPGIVIVEARYLLEIVRKMDCAIIQLESMDSLLVRIISNNGQYNLRGIDLASYTDIDFTRPENTVTLSSRELKQIIHQTAFACSDKEARPVLTGVNFKASGNELICSGTDSYRLAYRKSMLSEPQNFNVTIPAKSLQEVLKSLDDSEKPVHIYLDGKKAQFSIDHSLFQTRLIDGKFPDVERIIPDESRYISSMTVNTGELSRAIERTNFIRHEKIHLVKLECNDMQTRIKTSSVEIGNSDEVLTNAQYTGDDLNILINGTFMLDAIRALDSEMIQISFTGTLSPVKISSGTDENALMIVVPVRSYD